MAGARRISIRCGNRFKYPPMDRRRYLREQARSHTGMHFKCGSEPAREGVSANHIPLPDSQAKKAPIQAVTGSGQRVLLRSCQSRVTKPSVAS